MSTFNGDLTWVLGIVLEEEVQISQPFYTIITNLIQAS